VLQAIGILVVFFIFAALMMTQRMSTLLALICMAILIALIGGVPLLGKDGIVENVINGGALRLASAYTAVMFGAWLGQVMLQTGISQDIIRRAAELGGDRPMAVGIAMTAVTALLFTTMSGLGAVIMIGSIVLPILMGVGIKPLKAATIYLMGMAVGFVINLMNLNTYATLAGVTVELIKPFGMIQLVISSVIALAFVYMTLRKPDVAWAAVDTQAAKEELAKAKKVPLYSLLTPLIPLVLVLFLKWSVIPAFLVGIIYGALTTDLRDSLRLMTKAAHDGLKDGAPAILLMVAIGMVLNAVFHPAVKGIMQAVLGNLVPTSPIPYILFFAALAPLALYRGPLNMWGLGSGILATIISTGILSPMAAMAGFMSTERVQSVGDPTNTQTAWTASFTNVEVNAVAKKLLPWLWLMAAVSALVAGFQYL
jgi:TRAP-type C4-dicarboxylate transport system permease large subunit